MRPGKLRSSQRAVSRQNFRAEKSHVTRCTTRSALAVDAVRWSASVPSAVQPRPWLAVELHGNTRLPVNAFWNQASRSLGSLRRACDAVGAYAAGKASRGYQYMSRLVWVDVPYFSFNPVPETRGCC